MINSERECWFTWGGDAAAAAAGAGARESSAESSVLVLCRERLLSIPPPLLFRIDPFRGIPFTRVLLPSRVALLVFPLKHSYVCLRPSCVPFPMFSFHQPGKALPLPPRGSTSGLQHEGGGP